MGDMNTFDIEVLLLESVGLAENIDWPPRRTRMSGSSGKRGIFACLDVCLHDVCCGDSCGAWSSRSFGPP